MTTHLRNPFGSGARCDGILLGGVTHRADGAVLASNAQPRESDCEHCLRMFHRWAAKSADLAQRRLVELALVRAQDVATVKPRRKR